MWEGSFSSLMSAEPGVICIEGGVHAVRVHSVNEGHLKPAEPGAVDREGVYADHREGDGVEEALHQDNGLAGVRAVATQ